MSRPVFVLRNESAKVEYLQFAGTPGRHEISSIKAIETVQSMAGVLGMGQYSNQAAYGAPFGFVISHTHLASRCTVYCNKFCRFPDTISSM
jgi:hypothetical protein